MLLVTISIQSCTISKRVHRKGWYVSWNRTTKASGKTVTLQEKDAKKNEIPLGADRLNQSSNTKSKIEEKASLSDLTVGTHPDSQHTIKSKNKVKPEPLKIPSISNPTLKFGEYSPEKTRTIKPEKESGRHYGLGTLFLILSILAALTTALVAAILVYGGTSPWFAVPIGILAVALFSLSVYQFRKGNSIQRKQRLRKSYEDKYGAPLNEEQIEAFEKEVHSWESFYLPLAENEKSE